MKVTQEKLPASQIGLQIEIPPERSKQAYEQVIQNFARSAQIPGFRKGKVPRHVLLQRFGVSRLKAATIEDLLENSLKQAIEQEKIAAIGNFQLRSSIDELVQQFEPGQPLSFSAAVDVQPEVQLSQYKGLSVKAEEIKPDPEGVDKTLEERRTALATLVPAEGRSAQMGDIAVVDFTGYLKLEDGTAGEEIEGAKADNFQVELAEGRFIAGFVDGIVGMNPGETKEISVEFPEGYPQAEVAGKPALFTITLQELKAKELPDLDDDFAQEVSEFETLAELRASLEKQLQEQAERQTQANKTQALLNELLKQVEVELPETLIQQEVDYIITQTAMQFQNQGIDIKRLFTAEFVQQMRQRSRAEATDRIKRTLALGEVAKQESLQVEAAEIENKVKEFLTQQENPQQYDPDRLRSVFEEDLLKEKIIAWLEANATVELVPEGSLTPAAEEEATGAEATDPETAAE